MSPLPLATVIIDNYNFAQYLPEAIESALGQTYPNLEVIVVDDGSTDESCEIIASYGDRIRPVLKENGGQGSAFNAGFRECLGEVVIFLDADDTLLPDALAKAVPFFKEKRLVRVHWPLIEINGEGQRTGKIIPQQELPEGDLREVVITFGPASHLHAPLYGNAWARWYLDRILPMPKEPFRRGADNFIMTLSSIYGTIRRLTQPLGLRRAHADCGFWTKTVDEKTRLFLDRWGFRCEALVQHLAAMGITVDPKDWEQRNDHYRWMSGFGEARVQLSQIVPEGASYILIDDGQYGNTLIAGRQAIPLLEHEGVYSGPPLDVVQAIAETERLREKGATSLVIILPSFWWLDYYPDYFKYLDERYPRTLRSDIIHVYSFFRVSKS